MRGWYERCGRGKVHLLAACGTESPMKTVLPVTAALVLAALTWPATARDPLPTGFAYLRDIDASIVQDMRYASTDNFVGHPLPGYGAGECVLRRDVATALSKVQAGLVKSNLSLKVYDCYRPTRAVAAMARWANDGARETPTKRFFPTLEKRTLFASGYIAAQSAHSTGTAIDLTIVRLPAATPAPYDLATRYGFCTAPAAERAPDTGIDMGTGFDCFDLKSHTSSSAILPDQKRGRGQLLAAMRAHGFHNYFREWWHFTYGGVRPTQFYDFPIPPRTAR
jgi:D-alanyl-D-alanine dipeptidase